MTCRELIEFLIDYTEGNLTPAEQSRFDEHLAVCPQCVTYLADYRKTVALAKASADEPVPVEVPDELVTAVLAARKS